jgi:glutamine synthetase
MRYQKEDILRLVEEEDVKFIRLQFVDVFGQMKNIAVTPLQLERGLNGHVMIDGSSIDGFTDANKSDLYLHPVLDTFAIYPWRPSRGRVARLMCEIRTGDGAPFAGDPRAVLQKVCDQAAQQGYFLNVGPECEFFLFHTDDRGEPIPVTTDQAGYFDLSPLDQGENVRREVVLALEEMGYQVECSHHETAPGQHEIDFRYAPAMTAADDILTFKLAVKTLAQRNGFHATFMPKPITGTAGSGMHLNFSLHDGAGNNLFGDETGSLTPVGGSFIAGLMAHINAITAVTNPLINSYKRLVPGYEAPCYNSWSVANRTTLIRIPDSRSEQLRVELRSPDCTCNPYLALAVCLAAGLDGIQRGLTPPPQLTADAFAMSEAERTAQGANPLPRSLKEALEALRADPVILRALGEHISTAYLAGKEREWEEYCTQVSEWERQRYMVKY